MISDCDIYILTLHIIVFNLCYVSCNLELCAAACLCQDTLTKEIFHLSVAFVVKQKFNNYFKKFNKWP